MRLWYGMPSRLTKLANRYGWASASWIISPPPLEWPITGTGRPGLTWSNTASASRRSASQEYSAAWSLSPWPRWSQLTTRQPAAASSGANTSYVRAKSKPPWTREQRRRVGVAPLVDGEADAVGVEAVLAVRRTGARERDVGVGHRRDELRRRAAHRSRPVRHRLRCGGAIALGAALRVVVASVAVVRADDDDTAAQADAAADRDHDHDDDHACRRRPRSRASTRSRSGDTLTEIAAAYGLPVQAIMEPTASSTPTRIQAGQILELPLAVGDRGDVAAAGRPRRPARSASPAVTTVAP